MKKVYLETFGCQMNVSDSERAASSLESKGYEIISDENLADIVLFNTCSVREKTEHKLYSKVGKIRSQQNLRKPLIGVLGCVAQLEGETLFQKSQGIDFVLGTKAVGRVSNAIEEVLNGRKQFLDLGKREENYDWSVSETQRNSPHVGFIPIIEGCNKFCTYCIVPFSRGRERSLVAFQIIQQVLKLRDEGIKEIHLIGQNVNSYRPKTEEGLEKFKGATAFSRLLRAVAATGIERIKFTTSFPRDFHSDIVDAINENENLCNWVHLPVQSGSNDILKAMRRGHSIESYLEKIDKIKSAPERISLTSDFIVGFPNETEKDFRETLKLVEYCQFDSSYVFKYSPRPGTPAFQMIDNVSEKEKTIRFLEFEKIQKIYQQMALQSYINKTVDVLVEKFSSKNPKELSGHTKCHKVVNFESKFERNNELMGKIIKIKVTKSKANTLYGNVI
ncbi:MAG: tRNA (N6-isopentenyl adenosine(37)-C2)-methylthiotransferase MiaB [Acidobacteria bacterium]|nr:tRNA (N6-isopentenyl adenosine(37)-C2)-methylthiotransferase MiaB [Acidobacteriota bacterium]MCA1639572.1 tRNA (N6-isopentenyl adenosine(37)-C2)-methylthiotransferase MiaB [Acidobacteriota bacterium]